VKFFVDFQRGGERNEERRKAIAKILRHFKDTTFSWHLQNELYYNFNFTRISLYYSTSTAPFSILCKNFTNMVCVELSKIFHGGKRAEMAKNF